MTEYLRRFFHSKTVAHYSWNAGRISTSYGLCIGAKPKQIAESHLQSNFITAMLFEN